jgi:16S rRNA (guanine966-N2)-methyltransferase
MRVTGGRVRGTRLRTLPSRSVRPTTSLVKRAIFSVLENMATDWGRVLDLYAGSGALGIEALSRGAEWVDFVDHRRKCCDIIRANLQQIGETQRAHVYCCTANKALTLLEHSYDIIFMDPPYADLSTGNLLGSLAESTLPAQNSTIVVCHGNRVALSPVYGGLSVAKERRYGDTFISLYRKEA